MELAENAIILLIFLTMLVSVLWMGIRQDRKERKIRNGRYKLCLFCNREIRKKATVCKYCKSTTE